jgi:hypothetical protein
MGKIRLITIVYMTSYKAKNRLMGEDVKHIIRGTIIKTNTLSLCRIRIIKIRISYSFPRF